MQTLPFWAHLSDKEKAAISACAQIRKCGQGELVYAKDQECLGLIRMISGTVRVFMLSEEGREIVLYRIPEGDIDVLSASCVVNQIRFETHMVADIDCEILIVPAVCLAQFKESNLAVRCFIYEKLGERFSDVMLLMQNMLFSRMDSRIAKVLMEKAQKTNSKSVYLTHAQIASELNSSREVISRVLKELEKSKMITLGRGVIRIEDISALESLAAINARQ